VRKLCAILFAIAAFFVGIGYCFALFRRDPLPAIAHIAFASFSLTSAITAFYLFRSRESWQASLVCPSCRYDATLSPCMLAQPHLSVIVFLLGGIIFSVLIQQSRKLRYRCAACSAESSHRTLGSWLSLVWCFVVAILIVASGGSR
jgi:hypothetical protein